jgi:hypothetical protein
MSNFVWCHGPKCHESHTQDRIRGVKGSKVLRTKKVAVTEYHNMHGIVEIDLTCPLISVVKVVTMTLLINM